jgi:hypothetical protein
LLRAAAHLGRLVGRPPQRLAGGGGRRLRDAGRVRSAAARPVCAARSAAGGQRRRRRARRRARPERDLDHRRAGLRGATGARRRSGQGAACARAARRRGSG